MTFPTIPTAAAGRILTGIQANATATRTFPSLTGLTKNSGDLLIAICVAYQTGTGTNAAFSGWGGGFTEFHDSATSTTMAIGCAYKFSTGSETGTFTVTQAATVTGHAVFFLLSIPGVHPSTPPEAGGRASGTNAAANAGALDPAGWGTEDSLWITLGASGEDSTAGSYLGMTALDPNLYSGSALTGITADVVGGCDAMISFRQAAVASEDPDVFNNDISNIRWSALTIAVRPAIVGSASLSLSGSGAASAATVASASLSLSASAPTVAAAVASASLSLSAKPSQRWHTFNGGSEGATVSTSESGAPYPPSAVTPTGSGLAEYRAASAYSGAFGARISGGAGDAMAIVYENAGFSPSATAKYYLRFNGSVPDVDISTFKSGSTTIGRLATVSGKLSQYDRDGVLQGQMTTVLSADTWYQITPTIVLGASTSTGNLITSVYNATTFALIETVNDSSANAGFGTVGVTHLNVGKLSTANAFDLSLDEVYFQSNTAGSALIHAPVTGTASLSLSASGTVADPGSAASGTASLGLSASGSGQVSGVATATLDLSGAGAAGAVAAASASLSLSGTGTASIARSGTASLSLSAAGASAIGGTVVRQGTFESTSEDFSDWFSTTVARNSTSAHSGSSSLEVVSGANSFGVQAVQNGGSGTYWAAVSPSRTYVASIWLKQDSGSSPLNIFADIEFINGAGGEIAGTNPQVGMTLTTGWTELRFPAFAPLAGAVGAVFYVYSADSRAANNGVVWRIDDVSVQLVDAAGVAGAGAGSGSLSLSASGVHSSTASASLSLSATGAAEAPLAGSASLALSGSAVHSSVGSASLSLAASGAAEGAGSGSASLSLSGSAVHSSVGAASLSLSGSGASQAPVDGSASLSLSGVGTHSSVGTASLSLSLSASGAVAASPSGVASLTLNGTGVQSSVGSASLSLFGAGTAQAVFTATASLDLTGSGVQSSVASAALSLTGSGSASVAAVASASLDLAAAGSAGSGASGTASLSVSGSGAAVSTGVGSAALSLSGSADTRAELSASGSLELAGSGAAGYGAAGTASLSLSGTGAATVSAVAAATLDLAGSAVATSSATASASLTLSAAGNAGNSRSGTASLDMTGTGVTGPVVASASASLSLTGAAVHSSLAAASLTLAGAGATTTPIDGSASLDLSASGTATIPGTTGAASLSLSASGAAMVSAPASGFLSLNGSLAASTPATGAASLALSMTGVGGYATSATASLSVSAAGAVAASPSGSASITLLGSATPGAVGITGTASLSFNGSTSFGAATTGTASVLVNAVGNSSGRTSGTGSIVISGAGAGLGGAEALASLSLQAEAQAIAVLVGAATLSFSGSGAASTLGAAAGVAFINLRAFQTPRQVMNPRSRLTMSSASSRLSMSGASSRLSMTNTSARLSMTNAGATIG